MIEYNSKKHKTCPIKELGKIEKVDFGRDGYQGCQFGARFELKFGDSSGVTSFITGGWDYNLITCDKNCKWTEEDRNSGMAKMCRTISDILHDAKCDDFNKLVGKPIEVASEGFNEVVSWRILSEVL
jgi:hypothetical protein